MILKKVAALFLTAGLAVGLAGCGDDGAKNTAPAAEAVKTIKVGVSPVPGGDLMKEIAPVLAKEGVKLESIEFSDYIQPNLALADGSLDANLFQHTRRTAVVRCCCSSTQASSNSLPMRPFSSPPRTSSTTRKNFALLKSKPHSSPVRLKT